MKTRFKRQILALLAVFSAGIVSASAVDDIESLAAAADEALFATVPQAKNFQAEKKIETEPAATAPATPPVVKQPAKQPVASAAPKAVENKTPVVKQPAKQPVASAAPKAVENKTPIVNAGVKNGKDRKAKKDKGAKAKAKDKKPPKDMRITSENSAFDRKENIMLFDKNVFLDDDEYKMHADRVFVFMQGSNDVKRVVALGRVAITNELKSAICDKAVYDRPVQRVVMYGAPGKEAVLKDSAKKGGTVSGTKITFWLDSEQMEVESSTVTLPAGTVNQKSMKNALGR